MNKYLKWFFILYILILEAFILYWDFLQHIFECENSIFGRCYGLYFGPWFSVGYFLILNMIAFFGYIGIKHNKFIGNFFFSISIVLITASFIASLGNEYGLNIDLTPIFSRVDGLSSISLTLAVVLFLSWVINKLK